MSKHGSNYNEQCRCERDGFLGAVNRFDCPLHNEQTLRPVSEVAESVFTLANLMAQPRYLVIEALTTDRDAAYTMLRVAISKKRKDIPGDYEWASNYNEALDDILKSLDTIYGKTHTV